MSAFFENIKSQVKSNWISYSLTLIFAIGVLKNYLASTAKDIIQFFQQNAQSLFVDIVLLIVLFRLIRLERRVSELVLKSWTIYSDSNNTKFLASNRPEASTRINRYAVVAEPHDNWLKANTHYPEIKKAIWLAHDVHITNEEAIHGGSYTFGREFNLPCRKSAIRSAELVLLVDDECGVKINDYEFEKIRCDAGPNGDRILPLRTFDLIEHLRDGENTLEFLVDNDSFENRMKPGVDPYFAAEPEKWKRNPYGLKYYLTLRYQK